MGRQSTWAPAESAPKDGREFDGWFIGHDGGTRIPDIRYARLMGTAFILQGRQNIVTHHLRFTHWMDRPEPPEGAGRDFFVDGPEVAPVSDKPSSASPQAGGMSVNVPSRVSIETTVIRAQPKGD